ncbi:unnamed protein product [Rotaria magnacalcarata]
MLRLFQKRAKQIQGSSSSTTEYTSNNTNVIKEAKDTTSNSNICTSLTHECTTNSNEQVASASSMDTVEQMTTSSIEKMSRRERKMQERWTTTTKVNKTCQEQLPTKSFLGVEFPPIAVLRRKFSSSPPSKSNTLPIKKKDNSSSKTKTSMKKEDKNNSSQDNISKSNGYISLTPLNRSMSLQNQEINTSVTTGIVDQTKKEHQVLDDLQSNDTSSILIRYDGKTNDDAQQSATIILDLLRDVKSLQEDMKIKTKQHLIEYENETFTPTNNDSDHYEQMNINNNNNNNNNSRAINDSCNSHSPSSSSSLLLKYSSSLPTNANEDKTIELSPTEILAVVVKEEEEEEEEERKKEEEHCDDDNVRVEKKNKCDVEHNYHHATGTILINDESTQPALLEQEKKENEEEQENEQPLPTLEQCNQQQFENESLIKILSNNLETKLIMSKTIDDNNEERYKTIEIEEIPDEDDELSEVNDRSIEPIDCILTDDELQPVPRQTSTKPNIVPTNDKAFFHDPIISSYQRAMSKIIDTVDDPMKPSNSSSKDSQSPLVTNSAQRPEDDPIALRALKRFEQSMNAAMATKGGNDDVNASIAKGKSSWSGTLSAPRKSLESVFKHDQSNSSVTDEQSTTKIASPLISPRDAFIQPRKTILDDIGINLGLSRNLFGMVQNSSTNDENHKIEEQQMPIAILENNVQQAVPDESTTTNDSEGHQQQENPSVVNSSMANENGYGNAAENLNSLATSEVNGLLNTVISHPSTEQQTLSPYRLQLEGRRRLNTLERMRDRHENRESNSATQQFQNTYTVKPEELQDPIVRRALERFDEKSRSLAQTKSTNYDDIQDPITRRALIRLETNLKRTIPPNPAATLPVTNNDSNETWYTNSYTLGSLQTHNDNRPMRYPDSALPSTPLNRPPHVSVHQRFCSTSSADMSEPSTNSQNSNNDHDIPIMRVPAQPIYVTSNNHHQPQPSGSLRQRAHSEDMLSSRDITINEITNPDMNNTPQLQRNHSSDQLQLQPQEGLTSNGTDLQTNSTIIKSLDPNFVRTAEASINYTTPTQTYSAYSCEYTRPHQNPTVTPPKLEVSSPRNYQPSIDNDVRYSNVPSSAFTPVHPSTNNNPPPPPPQQQQQQQQQSLPAPSYASMYTANNLNQTTYSDDPIVRRALERFNCQMQNSLMTMSQCQPNTNGLYRQNSNGYPRQSNFDSFYPTDPQPNDPWTNFNRPMQPSPASATTGYQSIIGRRRQLRHDDIYHDTSTVGNGYSSSAFINGIYMNFSDEPPALPPRLHRDLFQEQQEYLCENVNNNNNNNLSMQQVYPTGPNGFRPINQSYMPSDSFHQFQDEEYLRHRAQSTSSTTSSDSAHPIRLNKQQLPPTFTRTNIPQNKKISPDDSQVPSGHTTPSNGSAADDSVFNRLAYTTTKSSLSKSSSNLCANLLNKPPRQEQPKQNNLKPYEIEYDDSPNIPNKQDSMSTSANLTNKCQRSRSVDGRARLKNAQARSNNHNNNNNNNNNNNRSTNDSDDNTSIAVPPSKFTPASTRRDAPPPRIPVIPRTVHNDRTPLTKRVASGHNLAYTRNANGMRARNSHGNLMDTDNDENLAFHDHYQPKIIDNKSRTSIPTHRYGTNHIQSSASTSSVTNTVSRNKISILGSLDKKDSNASGTDLHRSTKRPEENRLVSPAGQRRNVPVSVFSSAKHENKRPVPSSSTSPTNDSGSINNGESPLEPQRQNSYSSQSTGDSSYPTMNNGHEMNTKLSPTNPALKTSTGNILDELALTHDKHDSSKKMNVFERLFRGHKKKV